MPGEDYFSDPLSGQIGPEDASRLGNFYYNMLHGIAVDAPQYAIEQGRNAFFAPDIYDPAPAVNAALGTMGGTAFSAPYGSLGAGPARFPQFAERYPKTAAPVETAKESGGTYLAKQLSPEAEQFAKARTGVTKEMQAEGYAPYFDPAERFYADSSQYPARNVDTLTLIPAKQETINKYLETINAPQTRKQLREAYEKGLDLGNAEDWYAMGQLEQAYTKELGKSAGRKAFLDEFATPMAATTSGNNPQANFLMAQYLEYARKLGSVPTAGYELPVTVGGRYASTNLRDYARVREGGGYAALGADQPKQHNFARSFLGDLDRAVMDEQMAAGMLAHAKDPAFADRARKGAFGLLEAPVHAEAAAAAPRTSALSAAATRGVLPGNYQDVAWAGFKGESAGPMINVINDAIERTHRLTGMSRDEIVRRGLIRKQIPIYGLGGAAVPYALAPGDQR